MKILLDENLDTSLRKIIGPGHEVHTVSWRGWSGEKNGELLRLMTEDEYEILITADKNLSFQQSLHKFPITVFLLDSRSLEMERLLPLIPELNALLEAPFQRGLIVISEKK